MGVIIRFLFILLIGLFGGFLVHWFGSLLIDQFKGAWKAGNERRGVILGALAIGTSLALVLLESNLYNLAILVPRWLSRFYLTSPPSSQSHVRYCNYTYRDNCFYNSNTLEYPEIARENLAAREIPISDGDGYPFSLGKCHADCSSGVYRG